jgi:endoglucanase
MRDRLLEDILSQPTAPFRERHVIRVLLREFAAAGVPCFQDPIGNIVVGAATPAEVRKLLAIKTSEPVRIFIAHLDHPGFHGTRWRGDTELEIKWHGGSPLTFLDGANCWLADLENELGRGQLAEPKMLTSGRALESAVLRVDASLRAKNPDATGLFGGLSFRAPWWRQDGLIYTQAADDLVGSFAIASLALDLREKRKKAPFLGLLTRAEEVGFIGAIGHFELGWYDRAKRPVLCVSLETSRALPGAEIGKGPVVRLGDRYTVFDSGALRVFTELAESVLPERHQRRVMDGGTCEATAATVYGFPCVGISVPLGNYHNQSFEGGPDSRGANGPAPEFVHQDDVTGLLELCHALLKPKAPWDRPWNRKRKDFRQKLRSYAPLLKTGS